MKTLRRIDIPNTLYYITIVTRNRQKSLLKDVELFWISWGNVQLEAWVIMPDHTHILVNSGENGISHLIHNFKLRYAIGYRKKYGDSKVWQNRFWDHVIRDQTDLNNHLNYIHYNPVKHGMVSDPFSYEHSSLNKFYMAGMYERIWGIKDDLTFEGDFGE
ncbi:MAG: transposase [candidate division Zixibacteria bacterium]|nr:transposase [candidate division Zixibacteria bacterium]